MPVTKDQAAALASLATAIRPNGARRWDTAGVVAAIGRVKHLHLADVAMAVIRAADDRALETPGAIGNPKAPCWADRRADRPQPPDPVDPAKDCDVCYLPESRCRLNPHSGHAFESRHDADRRRANQPRRKETTDAI